MRDFSLTVRARAARDPEFAWELISELLEESKRLREEVYYLKSIIRSYQIGFTEE